MNLLDNIAKLRAEYDAAVTAAVGPLRASFGDIFKPFLDATTGVVSHVAVRAYTPYFMDGDECIYSVHDPEFFLVGAEDDYSEWGLGYGVETRFDEIIAYFDGGSVGEPPSYLNEARELGDKLRPLAAAMSLWAEAVRATFSVPDDLFKAMFGDHVQVTVSRDGVTTDEYEHE